MSKRDKILRIVLSVLFFAAVAVLGRMFTDTSTDWYTALTKPALQPPAIVFGIVWTILYILLAASAALALTDPQHTEKTRLLYAITGVANVLWTYTFFTLQYPTGALFVLLGIIVAAIVLFAHVYRIQRTAAYLLIPYIVWLFFALYLNYEIAFLN
jgi:tryptophan-rich sensory protein